MVLQYGLIGKDAGSQILWPELDPKTHLTEGENSHKLFGLHMHKMLYPHPQNILINTQIKLSHTQKFVLR